MKLDKETIKKILFEVGKYATAVIVAVAFLMNWLDGQITEQVSTQVPAVLEQVQARATPTPKGRGTATPTKVIPSATPSQTPTKVLPTNTPAPTGTPGALDPCSNWHPYQVDLRFPGMGAFDFGVNPCTLIPVFGKELENYLVEQNIDGLPHSSASEEIDGYTWLYVRVRKDGTQDTQPIAGEGCALFDNDPAAPTPDKLCITNVGERVHMRGDMAHAKKRNHSVFVVARVCGNDNGNPVEPCGTVITMGIEDWGVKHTPYKNGFCFDETTPRHWLTGALYPFDLIGQPPYIALQPARNGYAHQFVSTVTFNPVVEDYYHTAFYPEFPNHIIRSTWNLLDATEQFVCGGDPIPTGYKAVKFILHAVVLANLPDERPFNGFTDQNGYEDKTCKEISLTCFSLIITKDTPIGTPFMSYPVQMDGKNADGSSTGVVIQDFGK